MCPEQKNKITECDLLQLSSQSYIILLVCWSAWNVDKCTWGMHDFICAEW